MKRGTASTSRMVGTLLTLSLNRKDPQSIKALHMNISDSSFASISLIYVWTAQKIINVIHSKARTPFKGAYR